MSDFIAVCYPVAVPADQHHVQAADYSPRGVHYGEARFAEPAEPFVVPASAAFARRAIRTALSVAEELGPIEPDKPANLHQTGALSTSQPAPA